MKKIIAIILATLMLAAAGCSQKAPPVNYETYAAALDAVRTDEEKENFPAVTSKSDEMADGVFAMLGLNADDVVEFAAACSFMNVNAYCIAIFEPAAGKAADIEAALKKYIELTKSNMENYLPDQFEIAKKAAVETTQSGNVVIVMGQSAIENDVLDKLKAASVG